MAIIKAKRQRLTVGAFVKIPINDRCHTYGRILKEPLFVFYDCLIDKDLPLESIACYDVAFKIWVANKAVTSGRWQKIGKLPLERELEESASFFMIDNMTGNFSIYQDGVETPATREACADLECAAVWSPEHVEDRLRDHFAGKANKWVESMRP